jgi:hypothetical protein
MRALLIAGALLAASADAAEASCVGYEEDAW